LFILMTNRPDRLDTDIKRPGRLDRKIPFFYAETAAERAAVVSAVLKRYGVSVDLPEGSLLAACEALEGYSNADLEALALLATEFAERRSVPGRSSRPLPRLVPPRQLRRLLPR
jgi:transitional endoplasmic reticulum ATPase